MSGARRGARTPAAVRVLAAMGLALVGLPVLGLLVRVGRDHALGSLWSPGVRTAMWLSLTTSLCATAIAAILGVPTGWVLARSAFRGREVFRALVLVPLVLPPVVGGVALLAAFGGRGLVGGPLADHLGWRLAFTPAAAVLAQSFVSLPFMVAAVDGALRSVGPLQEEAAMVLGASPWRVMGWVTLPSIRSGLVSGVTLAWARALGEFGATLTFAGNVEGRTRTVPLAVYLALDDDPKAATTLSLSLVVVSVAIIVALRRRWLDGLRNPRPVPRGRPDPGPR